MSGPFGWEEFGEYFDEEPSATDITINPIGSNAVVNSPIVENAAIVLPHIASTTQVFTPTVENTLRARLTQEPVEALVQPSTQKGRLTQEPVEVIALPTTQKARLTQEPVEVLVGAPQMARVSQEPVEVVILPTDQKARVSQMVGEVVIANVVPVPSFRAYIID